MRNKIDLTDFAEEDVDGNTAQPLVKTDEETLFYFAAR